MSANQSIKYQSINQSINQSTNHHHHLVVVIVVVVISSGDIGGVASLWLGASIVAVAHFVLFCIQQLFCKPIEGVKRLSKVVKSQQEASMEQMKRSSEHFVKSSFEPVTALETIARAVNKVADAELDETGNRLPEAVMGEGIASVESDLRGVSRVDVH